MDIKDFQHLPLISGKKVPKVEYEFQDICLQYQEYFGNNTTIWTLPYKKGCTESLMRYALKESKQRDKPFLNYAIKIINNQLKK